MLGSYSKIFKQAYEIMQKYKFLWILGLFLSLTDVIFFVVGRVDPMPSNGFLISAGLLFSMALLVFSYRFKTSIIIAAKAVLDKQPVALRQAYKTSVFFYWRVFGVTALMEIAMLILVIVVSSPVTYLNGIGETIKASSLGIIGGIILLPIIVVMVFIKIIAPIFVVVYDQKIGEAINKSYDLIVQFWQRLLFVGIFIFLLQISSLFLTLFMLKLMSGTGIVVGILPAITYIILNSFTVVFSQIVWVLLFHDLIKPQKFETPEPTVAPEIVS